MSRFSIIIIVTIIIASCVLSACTLFSPETPIVNMSINAAEYLNPDIQGKASPVVLTIYQLNKSGKFKQANFFTLSDNTAKALSDDLLDKSTLVIKPNTHEKISLALSTGTKFLGITAAFRNINHTTWRQTLAVEPSKNKKTNISINLASQSLTVEPKQ